MIINNSLRFDEKSGRYYLTEEYVYNQLGIDLDLFLIDDLDTNVSTSKKRKIEYACDMLYDYVDRVSLSKKSAYYLFQNNEEVNDILVKALELQLNHFIIVGDTSMDVESKKTINARAISKLDSCGIFDTIIYGV